jgi:hypothetical protein
MVFFSLRYSPLTIIATAVTSTTVPAILRLLLLLYIYYYTTFTFFWSFLPCYLFRDTNGLDISDNL